MCFECFDVLLAHIAGPPGAVPPPPRYADHTWYVARLSDTSRRENPDLFPENLLFSVERNRVVVGATTGSSPALVSPTPFRAAAFSPKKTKRALTPSNSPFFVTWETSNGSILRGCIGTLTPRRLIGGLGEYALLAGTRDGRFEPVTSVQEVERLAVKISLLHSYEKLPVTHNDDGDDDDEGTRLERRVYDWDLDTHGLTVEFFSPSEKGRLIGSATYLPGVARAQGWTKQQTLASLATKAGVDVGRFGMSALLRSARATRYRSSVARATHDEYLEARQLADENS